MLIGALEAGGTKMVCAIGKEDGTILEQVSIPTTTPEETIPKLIEYFKDKEIEALGVAAFGPVDVKPESETYGYILDTPKLAWRHKDLLGRLKAELKVPMGLDTDVNGSCLGEACLCWLTTATVRCCPWSCSQRMALSSSLTAAGTVIPPIYSM